MTDVRHTSAWQTARRVWATRLPQPCPFCHEPVNPWQHWDLDHQVPVKFGGARGPTRPAHRSCNRAAGHEARMNRREHVPLDW